MPTINASPITFEPFDLIALRQASRNCNDKWIDVQTFHSKTNYLTEFHNKIRAINLAINEADFDLPGILLKVRMDLTTKITTVKYLQDELAEASDEEDREDILKDMADLLSNATDKTRDYTSGLASRLQPLNASISRSTLQRRLEACEGEALQVPEDIVTLQEKKAVLDVEYATLTSAINALDSTPLPETGKETILDPAALASLGLTAPQLAAAQAALEMLQKALQELNAALNYLGLISLRDSLRRRIDRVLKDIADKKIELGKINDRIRLIEAIQGFDDERTPFINEFSTIVTSLNSFMTETADIASDDVLGEQFVQNANALINYLKPIR
ncbi:alpha-xenorhabdolysin family binary toxin subunit B [Pseudomonas caspiana]